jgi:hypothetical protein
MVILEQIAAEIFRRASNHVNETPIDMRVDPYTMRIEEGRDVLMQKSNTENAWSVFEPIRRDIDKVWLLKTRTPEHDYTR